MKTFLAVSCLLAVASAQYHQQGGYHGQNAGPTGGYQGPLHFPVLTANGVPQEPAAVVQARNSHLANFGGTAPASTQYQDESQYNHQPQQYQSQYQPQYQAQSQHYEQQQQPQAVLGANGLPQDAPDVAAARAAHFAAYAEANARNGAPQSANQHYAPQQQQYYNPVPQYNPAAQYNPSAPGPADTPEVAAAKAAHFAAHAQLASAPAAQQHY